MPEDKLLRVIQEGLGLASVRLGDDSDMTTVPNWDSLAHIKLVLHLEAVFGVRFLPDEIQDLTSVRKIRNKLQELKKLESTSS